LDDSPVRRFIGLRALPLALLAPAILAFALPQRAVGQAASSLSRASMVIPQGADMRFAAGAEQALLDLQNGLRVHHRRQALLMNDRLRAVARRHSREMALGGFIGHESPSMGSLDVRLRTLVGRDALVAENVAFASTIAQAERAFEASPGHLRNMLDPRFHSVGIGIATVPRGVLVTEDFAN
jgi:uncharacterized protein YkwD